MVPTRIADSCGYPNPGRRLLLLQEDGLWTTQKYTIDLSTVVVATEGRSRIWVCSTGQLDCKEEIASLSRVPRGLRAIYVDTDQMGLLERSTRDTDLMERIVVVSYHSGLDMSWESFI